VADDIPLLKEQMPDARGRITSHFNSREHVARWGEQRST